jgi:hypothetical protein
LNHVTDGFEVKNAKNPSQIMIEMRNIAADGNQSMETKHWVFYLKIVRIGSCNRSI